MVLRGCCSALLVLGAVSSARAQPVAAPLPLDGDPAGPPPRVTEPPAAGDARPAVPSPPRTFAVRGTVLIVDIDEPLVGVEIEIRGPALTRRVLSADDGTFVIESVPPGRYALTLVDRALGEATAVVEVTASDAAVTLGVRTEVVAIESRYRTESEALRESAAAVSVVDTAQARRASADLGEVLARSSSVAVSRSGGLGSDARLSLAGLSGEQVRVFLDGVPLDLAGFGGGVGNVPVNLIDRVEVYRGVVPIRFGTDALGGAVNLVTVVPDEPLAASASYQVGSFGTHRVAATVSRGARRGPFAMAHAYFDRAANDYDVDVKVAGAGSQQVAATVPRFHDGYLAFGADASAGWAGEGAGERIAVRAFVGGHDKDLQHNPTMTRPYGGVRTSGLTAGTALHYRGRPSDALTLATTSGYAWGRTDLVDTDTCIYDWYGNCGGQRDRGGEIENRPRDRSLWPQAVYTIANAELRVAAAHALRASIAPTFTWRRADERREMPGTPDPLELPRSLLSATAGVEHQMDGWGDRIENVVFAKGYLQMAAADERLPSGVIEHLDRSEMRFGAGDALRVRVREWVWLKASYEYATRLPNDGEIFGDGVQIEENLDLRPEVSHNGNLGVAVDLRDTASGTWKAEVGGLVRDVDQLIRLAGTSLFSRHQNVVAARALGVDASASWSSPGDHVRVDGSAALLDFRNTSSSGVFASYQGDRIPNLPYLHAAATAGAQLRRLLRPGDTASASWTTRYVHGHFLTWESLGARETKPRTPSQLVHTAAVTYQVAEAQGTAAMSLEIQNVSDERVYDLFGVQRPGRALFLKLTVER
jgi:vitamin B12 transporter